MLLQHGALVDVPDIDDIRPLYIASAVGHLKCVVMLVEHGTDVNKCCTSADVTPLMACTASGRLQVMSYLLANGANVNARDKNGLSALQIAHLNGHSKCVQMNHVYKDKNLGTNLTRYVNK